MRLFGTLKMHFVIKMKKPKNVHPGDILKEIFSMT